MERTWDELETFLAEVSVDGYLIDASGTNANQRYLTGFDAVDPFTSLYRDGAVHLLVRGLDKSLAAEQSGADSVATPATYDRQAKLEEFGQPEADHRVVAAFLEDHGVDQVGVPARFPLARAEALRDVGIAVCAEERGIIESIRAVKTQTEIEHIQRAQQATEQAMARAETLLEEASSDRGVLQFNGEPLTSERVKAAIEVTLVENGCALEETIVACGVDAAKPHDRGSGPLIANEPIVIDIFPRDKTSRYHADMTRTVCVGEPSETASEWYALTRRAQDAAFEAIEAGVTGEVVHNAACDVFEDAGIPTLRTNDDTDWGFIHGTGHGIGLDVHERPSVSENGGTLEAGNVITIEPGIYDPTVGGIRIEDLVVVTENGYENLTSYRKEFII